MPPMLRFIRKRPSWGLEISAGHVRLAAVSRSNAKAVIIGKASSPVPPGMVTESYGPHAIADADGLAGLVRECLGAVAHPEINRVALSLPDGMFRVQTIEFEALPGNSSERERLIRWRLEKTAAFDTVDTVLRYQILRRQDTGFTVLACVAKQEALSRYETMLAKLGLETWSIGLSSFCTVNFYASYLSRLHPVAALAHVTEDSFSTIVIENNGARFYRYKEFKRVAADEVRARFLREIEDSLHFYTHMDRSQATEIGRLFLTGEHAVCRVLADELSARLSLEVEVLTPDVLLGRGQADAELAAALGAGGAL